MSLRTSNLWPLIPLVLLAGLSFWLEQLVQPESHDNSAARHDPDYWVENFSVQRLGPDGKPLNTLRGSKMTHFPDDDTTLIVNPKMIYYRNPPITLSAAKGLVGKDGKQITLENDVKITRDGRDGGSPLHVSTASMTVFPETEKARADSKVVIMQGKSILSGSAMDIDNISGISVLHGPVTATINTLGRQ